MTGGRLAGLGGWLRGGGSRVLAKYLVLQVPGWIGVALLLAAGVHWWELGRPAAFALFGAWVVKDLALFPVLRRAYEPGEPSAAALLLGRRGVVVRDLSPHGYVRVGAELWSARVSDAQSPLEAGTPVRVRAVEGLTLQVDREENALQG